MIPTQPSADGLYDNWAAHERLLSYLRALGIDAPVVDYPAHRTVEEGKLLRDAMSGAFTKNLLPRDRKKRLFLLSVQEDRALNLKTLHTRIGASGQLSFVAAEVMTETPGVEPGSMTPMASIDDPANLVTVVLDASLLEAEQVNFHPLIQTRSIGLRPDQLLAFVASRDRPPVLLPRDI